MIKHFIQKVAMLMEDTNALPQITHAPLATELVSALLNAVSEMRPVLVLDLDETVVYGTQIKPKIPSFSIRIGRRRFYIRVRPGFEEFFREVSLKFEVFFFTASKPQYADPIIDIIAPSVDYNHRLYSDSCNMQQGKDLSLINRPLNKVLLVDDVCVSGSVNPLNFIKIRPWMGEEKDNCLCEELLPLLNTVYLESDIPSACRKEYSRNAYPSLYLF